MWTATVPIRRRDGSLVADAGETTDKVPTRDVRWLQDGGWLVRADDGEG